MENEKTKELMEVNFEEDLKNAERELTQGTESLNEHKELLVLHEEIVEIYKEVKDVIIDGGKRIIPEFEFEKDPKYWAYKKKVDKLHIMQDYNQLQDRVIMQLKKTVSAKQEAVTSLIEKIARMKGDDNSE